MLELAATLLELADARVSAAQVLDLAALEPVRRRFRLDDDDLATVRRWVAEGGVRWGLDADARAPWQLEGMVANTWQQGLDRLLVGVAMGGRDDDLLDGTLPLDGVDSTEIALAGRFTELVDRLAASLAELRGPAPLGTWTEALRLATARLGAVADAESWQVAQLRRELAEVEDDAGAAVGSLSLSLADVRSLLAVRMAGRPTRANFRSGSLTVSTLVPMRSVPHRVVCLLGLDDGAFPRRHRPDGDDLLALAPCVGERNPGSEDRQLLLDAVLAATEALVITYSGADERTNAPRPPAVPVGELLDALDATVRTADDRPAREHLVVHHPLQPFDPRVFRAGALDPAGSGAAPPFGFDRAALAGARALTGARQPAPPFLATPVGPPPPAEEVELTGLLSALADPVGCFLRERLRVSVRSTDDAPEDALPISLTGLQEWQVGDTLLTDRRAGRSEDDCRAAARGRGTLPPGALGEAVMTQVVSRVDAVLGRLRTVLPAAATGRGRAVEVLWPLPDGRVLTGSVPDVHDATAVLATYSKLGPKQRLTAWVHLLALTVAAGDRPWTTLAVGRGPGGASAVRLGPVDPAEAEATLLSLVAVRDAALAGPLPLPLETAERYAQARRSCPPAEAERAAAGCWTSTFGDRTKEPAVYVWGREAPIGVLLDDPPAAAELAHAREYDETTRFGTLARLLWAPLQAAEERL